MSDAPDGPSDDRRTAPSLGELSWRQRILLLLILAAGTAVALAAFEVGLRAFGYGHGFPLFVTYAQDSSYVMPNPRVGERYFPDPRNAPSIHFDLFPAERKRDDFLVFVQGGSSAAGFPYHHGGAFSRMLEARLQETLPRRSVEVVNVAMGATNSYTLLDLADEIAAREPDAVLVYAGHNEYYGAYGVGSTVSLGRRPALIRTYLELRRFRVVQLLGSVVRSARGLLAEDRGGRPRTMMERLAREETVVYGSDRWRDGVRQFRSNLEKILATYEDAGVPVLIGTLASNERDQPPFLGSVTPGADSAAWAGQMQRAGEAAGRGDTAGALAALARAIAVDSAAANGFYARAHLLDGLGRMDEARRSYREAKDRDRVPFRAPSAMTRVIRETARRHGATVVPVLERLEQASPGGIVGDSLMLEHLHPTIHGQFLTADAFYRALRERGLPEEWGRTVPPEQARSRVPVTAVDSLYGRMVIDRLTSGWPFVKNGDPTRSLADTLTPTGVVEGLAVRRAREGMSWSDATRRLRDHYAEQGHYRRAIHVDRILGQVIPMTGEFHRHAARMALRLGDEEQALSLLRTAFRREETADVARRIGGLLASRGARDSAARYFRRGAELAPDDRQAAAALEAFRALPGVRRRAEENPNDAGALSQLAAVYLLTGQYRQARSTVRRALEIDPENPRARSLSKRLEALPLPEETAPRDTASGRSPQALERTGACRRGLSAPPGCGLPPRPA